LTNENALEIRYEGTTDKPTVFNPNAPFIFQPHGVDDENDRRSSAHDLCRLYYSGREWIDPDGTVVSVANTPMDFRTSTRIGTHIGDHNEQLLFAKGYDHNWVLRDYNKQVRKVAEVYEPRPDAC